MTMAHHPNYLFKKKSSQSFSLTILQKKRRNDNARPQNNVQRQRIAHLSTIKMASNRLLPQQQPWHLNSIRFLT